MFSFIKRLLQKFRRPKIPELSPEDQEQREHLNRMAEAQTQHQRELDAWGEEFYKETGKRVYLGKAMTPEEYRDAVFQEAFAKERQIEEYSRGITGYSHSAHARQSYQNLLGPGLNHLIQQELQNQQSNPWHYSQQLDANLGNGPDVAHTAAIIQKLLSNGNNQSS